MGPADLSVGAKQGLKWSWAARAGTGVGASAAGEPGDPGPFLVPPNPACGTGFAQFSRDMLQREATK